MSSMTPAEIVSELDKNIVGQPLTLGGKIYERGVGTHADSFLSV